VPSRGLTIKFPGRGGPFVINVIEVEAETLDDDEEEEEKDDKEDEEEDTIVLQVNVNR